MDGITYGGVQSESSSDGSINEDWEGDSWVETKVHTNRADYSVRKS